MRHRAAYRHARHQPGPSGWSYLIALIAALSALAAALALTAAPPPARAQAAPAAVTQARGAGQTASEPGLPQERARLGAARASLAAARERAALAALAAATYTVRAGDSLSRVAQARCGTARDWTGIYAASRARHWTAANANTLATGQRLFLACAWRPSMLRFAPAPPPPPAPVAVLRSSAPLASTGARAPVYNTRSVTPVTYQSSPRGSYGNVSASSYGGYQACVIARESGGSSQVMNASGHYGLYQFDAGTWASGGGSASTFGHASVAEQNRVFAAVYAARGTQPWSPSDGC